MQDYYSTRTKELYKTLHNGLPRFRSESDPDALDVRALAEELKISYQAIYAWFDRDTLPSGRVKKLIKLDGSTLTAEELLKFVA